jgi:sterol desaturase/sphingolipid hydroxylase (fatty acid hydroxylase superfamily)
MEIPMTPTLEIRVRLACFAGVLLIMSVWELLAPRRPLVASKGPRWFSNLMLVVINMVLARWLVPITAVAAAEEISQRGGGLLALVHWPVWLELLVAILALDFAIYLQHVLFHAVPVLWRLHVVHHADLDLDVTTGLRFHTAEILLSAFLKLAAVVLLGPSGLAVLLFEVILNATAMFNHSNVKLPSRVDRILRWVLVTPEMHLVHHSVSPAEMNSNFGFNVPWWDYLLGTFRAKSHTDLAVQSIGIRECRDEQQVERLPGMLALPFIYRATREQTPDQSDRPD